MEKNAWVKEFPGVIVVCDTEGTITYMNDKAVAAFEKYGGSELIGANVLDCHPEAARAKLRGMMSSQSANIYTVERDGLKKLIYQAPWSKDGKYSGFIEIMLDIPFDMPHFVRK